MNVNVNVNMNMNMNTLFCSYFTFALLHLPQNIALRQLLEMWLVSTAPYCNTQHGNHCLLYLQIQIITKFPLSSR